MLTIIEFYYHNFCYQIFSNILLDSEFENEAESEPNADEDRNEVGNLRSGRPIMLGLHVYTVYSYFKSYSLYSGRVRIAAWF